MSLPSFTAPEHTGENRCWPCTAANLGLLTAACAGLALVSPPASALLALGGAAVVWKRGYLVPYTPVLAPRVVDRLPVDPFHPGGPDETFRRSDTGGRRRHGDETPNGEAVTTDGGSSVDAAGTEVDRAPDGETVLADLAEAGVLAVDGDDVTLAGDFESRWRRRMDVLGETSPEELAKVTRTVVPTAADAHAVTERDRTYVVLSDGSGEPSGESWLRYPVAVSETAAADLLADFGFDPDRRHVAGHALGFFLEECPVCEADLVERPAGGCCGPPKKGPDGHPLRALVCEECRAQFAVFD